MIGKELVKKDREGVWRGMKVTDRAKFKEDGIEI